MEDLLDQRKGKDFKILYYNSMIREKLEFLNQKKKNDSIYQ